MLTVTDLSVHYGPVHAVRGVSLAVSAGSVTALLGANGAGKTTTLMAVAGARKLSGGSVTFEGEALAGVSPEDIIRRGVGVVPEGRRVFAALSVMENLVVAGSIAGDQEVARARREKMMERFPILAERRNQKAGLLSGGEQQMLAIARALMSAPKLLLLDEPSLGLAPQIVDQVFDLIETLRGEGLAILLVEQNVPMSLEVAENAVVLANGAVSVSGPARDLAGTDVVKSAYLAA